MRDGVYEQSDGTWRNAGGAGMSYSAVSMMVDIGYAVATVTNKEAPGEAQLTPDGRWKWAKIAPDEIVGRCECGRHWRRPHLKVPVGRLYAGISARTDAAQLICLDCREGAHVQ